MSISGDLLASAVPARLLCRRAQWTLELVRLVPVDRDLFQPKVQRLEGADAVLQHLKRVAEPPALAVAAAQLIRSTRGDEDRCYEAVEGEWVPVDPAERVRESLAAMPGAEEELAALRAELSALRASHERLRERVVELERSLEAPSGAFAVNG